MQESVSALEKRAIKAAISQDWELAERLNLDILKADKKNIEAKNRLGKAYLELKRYNKARDLFKEVLEKDPINQAAQKNLLLAKTRQVIKNSGNLKSNLILEPGTYAETSFEIKSRYYSATSFLKGQELILKPEYKKLKVLYEKPSRGLAELGEIDNEKLKTRILAARKDKVEIKARFLKGRDKTAIIMLEASSSIFEAEKQDVKPYMKRDVIEDPSENPEIVMEE